MHEQRAVQYMDMHFILWTHVLGLCYLAHQAASVPPAPIGEPGSPVCGSDTTVAI
ncbi:hypothetical protein PR001_g15877 [Phytophthora rubi]|uniref:Uncharacterized protein n=1 Tax=Phytophthora rubi TaxID=129364 RepID=A0A6A3KIW0_9STRA|nr:hypothetical protein PR002_g16245 [Phytophthora rubi]KAE9011609.1 hypothetical protein PR001_g15877 [Phytophthora rubi]